ncbi:MAG: AI-2E family transporter [Bacteroidota bacterium]
MEAESKHRTQSLINLLIKIALIAVVFSWSFTIIYPFVSLLVWGGIIAITLYPVYDKLREKLKGKNKMASVIISLLGILLILIPSGWLIESLVGGISSLNINSEDFELVLPPLPDKIRAIPLLGDKIALVWGSLSSVLMESLGEYKAEIMSAVSWFANALMGIGVGIIQFIVAVIISGVLLYFSESLKDLFSKFFIKIAGDDGENMLDIIENTVRSVSKGVFGVGLVQSLLLGVVFMLAGVPFAGLWALIAMILIIIQMGPTLVSLGVIIYLFNTQGMFAAGIWSVLILAITLADNVVKPIIMGKGSSVPMMVVFLGSLGGFITSGFVGLFIGAIILSVTYILFIDWLGVERTG